MLDNAVDAHRKNFQVYESLQYLNEVVGSRHGGRVLHELIQNAHDAHRADERGRIAARLVIRSDIDGILYIANGGSSFRRKDADAIKNLEAAANSFQRRETVTVCNGPHALADGTMEPTRLRPSRNRSRP